jgi:uncharacterized protein YggT (Ycf19 family)
MNEDEDTKVAADEARRRGQHQAVKSRVEGDVNAEITARAARSTRAESAAVDEAAGELRGRAVQETVGVEREVVRARGAARTSQFIDYAFYILYSLLLVRLGLALIAARSGAGFVQFIRAITDPFIAPFRGIVASPSTPDGNILALPVVIALVIYMLLHVGINGALRLMAHRKTQI